MEGCNVQAYKSRTPIDISAYDRPESQLEAKFGLPLDVKFCRRCVISNQRPSSAIEFAHTANSKKRTIAFDEEGVCDACRYAEQKRHIDWNDRHQELSELCDRFRSKDGSFDCIVPGSGGKDSFYAAHVLKYKYGMHPLTCTWAPHMYTDWGWRNFQNWIGAGFDNYLLTPNPRVHRLLTRLAVENLFHPFQPFIFGQKSFPPKLALHYNVQLVFYGESEAEYGNPIAETETAKREWSYFTTENAESLYLGGVSIRDLVDNFGLNMNDLYHYLPCNPNKLEEQSVEVHYLGYYLKWHPQSNYYYAVEHGDFEACPERVPGTYSKYCALDDKMEDFNYYTTGIKFGIGRATYDASQEIRSGDITREEGIALVKRFDLEFPHRFAEDFYRYISVLKEETPNAARMFEQPIVDHDYFMHLHDRFRSPHLWQFESGKWRLRHTVWEEAVRQNADLETQGAHGWTGNPAR